MSKVGDTFVDDGRLKAATLEMAYDARQGGDEGLAKAYEALSDMSSLPDNMKEDFRDAMLSIYDLHVLMKKSGFGNGIKIKIG